METQSDLLCYSEVVASLLVLFSKVCLFVEFSLGCT